MAWPSDSDVKEWHVWHIFAVAVCACKWHYSRTDYETVRKSVQTFPSWPINTQRRSRGSAGSHGAVGRPAWRVRAHGWSARMLNEGFSLEIFRIWYSKAFLIRYVIYSVVFMHVTTRLCVLGYVFVSNLMITVHLSYTICTDKGKYALSMHIKTRNSILECFWLCLKILSDLHFRSVSAIFPIYKHR